MASREDRIANLAATLKASGLAKSEVQARMMAEEMIGVEENVQKRYDTEHAKAQEYLMTAKNLGESRLKPQTVASQETVQQSMQTRKIEPLKTDRPVRPVEEAVHDDKVLLQDVNTDVNIGSGSLKDILLNQIKEDNHEVKNIEELTPTVDASTVDVSDDVMLGDVSLRDTPPMDSAENVSSAEPVEDSPVDDSQKLDGAKLQQMMEEDGPMEEHTREIKEKPKNVKPKEEYAENSADLSNMFNYNKK